MPNTLLCDDVIGRLANLDEDAFAQVVGEDLRKKLGPEEKAALRSPALVERFFAHLSGINVKVEGDLSVRREEVEIAEARAAHLARVLNPAGAAPSAEEARRLREAYDQWRIPTMRFHTGLSDVIVRTRPLRDEVQRSKVHPEKVERLERRIAKLEDAIRAHKASIDGDEARDSDRELWKFVAY